MLLSLLHCNRRIKSVSRLAENDEFLSSSLLERHISRFAESSNGREDSYFRTDFHKDKIVLHICLLALVLENYQVRPEDLCKDLHVPLSKIREYLRELGCVSRSSTSSDIGKEGNISMQSNKKRKRSDVMVLQVPLSFPERRRGRQ